MFTSVAGCGHRRLTIARAALVALCALSVQAQNLPARVSPLTFAQAPYRLRAGEARTINGSREALDFVRKAKSRRLKNGGQLAPGFVVGPGVKDGEVLVAASLTTKPGEYLLDLSAVSDVGEERVATLNVVVDPLQTVPSTATKPPVVLLNGWQFGLSNNGCPISNSSSDTFGNIAQYLGDDSVPVVYFFDNCVECPNCKIEDLGNTLGQVLNLITFDTGVLVPQIDAVSHSMGGLIARAYLSGLQSNGSLMPPANPRIRKLVLIAEPNFGSFVAPNLGVQTSELVPGSSLLWELATWNQGGDDIRGVDALAVIGNAGEWNGLSNASDGVVSLTSGSIGFARDQSRTRILPYCHITPSFLINLFMQCSAQPGIAQVDSPLHPTWTIIHSFLAGTSDWTTIGTTPITDPYLSRDGGVYFTVENSAGDYLNDLSQVEFGSAQLANGASPSVFYNEFLASGTGTFQFNSQSLGQHTVAGTVPAGYYAAMRSKFPPMVSSAGPLVPNASGRVVESGTTVTINGSGFGLPCAGCQVLAVTAGSPAGSALQILSWSDQAITVVLPATYNGFVKLMVQTASGVDAINIMVAAATRTISHIADGGGWRTTLILVNTATQAASFDLKFWDQTGNPLILNFGPDGVTAELSGTIQPGVTRFIHTAGTAAGLLVGWAELTAPSTVDGNCIFGLQSPGRGDSEAAVALSSVGATDLYIPFDYSTGYSTGIAFANPGQQAATVSASILDDSGMAVPVAQTISVPARGHYSDVLAQPFPSVVQKRGVAHFSSNTNLFGLGIRANGKAFTSIEALSGVPPAQQFIPHVASGGGWNTTFLLVNTDQQAADFTLRFWDGGGSPLALPLGADGTTATLTGVIQPGAIRIIQTAGTPAQLSTGWAYLAVRGAIGGTEIFSQQTPAQADSEAAVSFSTTASTQLFMPYDYTSGYSTGIALTNIDQGQVATVSASFVDDSGNNLGTGHIVIPLFGHTSTMLNAVLPGIVGTRGTISLTSNVPLFGIGIRADGVAFTSLKVIAQ